MSRKKVIDVDQRRAEQLIKTAEATGNSKLRAELAELDEEMLLLSSEYDGAIMGYAERCGQPTLAVYHYRSLVELVANHMDVEEGESALELAVEYVDYNIVGAWMGDKTPVFFHTTETTDDAMWFFKARSSAKSNPRATKKAWPRTRPSRSSSSSRSARPSSRKGSRAKR
jgi:hypothetical protein